MDGVSAAVGGDCGGRTWWLPAGTCRRHSSPYVDQPQPAAAAASASAGRGVGRRRGSRPGRRPTVVVVPELASPRHGGDDDDDAAGRPTLARTVSLRLDERRDVTPDVGGRDRRPSQLASKVRRPD